jgi:uncharacterized protein (DUF302 family)
MQGLGNRRGESRRSAASAVLDSSFKKEPLMKPSLPTLKRTAVAAGLLAGLLAGSPVFAGETSFQGTRVVVESSKSFGDVTKAVTDLVAKNGMMVLADVDQGKIMSMTGLKLEAKLFLVGNPTVGKQIFEQDHAVGLYVPFRLSVYSDDKGKTFVEYDKPSSILSQFGNEKIGMVGKMLDEKIGGLATMAAN